MRKSANRKIRPIRNPTLPLTEKHQEDLDIALHTATASLKTASGCNNFARILAVFTSAMDIEGKIDNHARNLIRTACLMLEKVTDTGIVDDKTHQYCKALAVWIDRWISQGRITYASLTEAKKIVSKMGVIMQCKLCGGSVEWRGPWSSLTHTECLSCGVRNCQSVEPESEDSEDVEDDISNPT